MQQFKSVSGTNSSETEHQRKQERLVSLLQQQAQEPQPEGTSTASTLARRPPLYANLSRGGPTSSAIDSVSVANDRQKLLQSLLGPVGGTAPRAVRNPTLEATILMLEQERQKRYNQGLSNPTDLPMMSSLPNVGNSSQSPDDQIIRALFSSANLPLPIASLAAGLGGDTLLASRLDQIQGSSAAAAAASSSLRHPLLHERLQYFAKMLTPPLTRPPISAMSNNELLASLIGRAPDGVRAADISSRRRQEEVLANLLLQGSAGGFASTHAYNLCPPIYDTGELPTNLSGPFYSGRSADADGNATTSSDRTTSASTGLGSAGMSTARGRRPEATTPDATLGQEDRKMEAGAQFPRTRAVRGDGPSSLKGAKRKPRPKQSSRRDDDLKERQQPKPFPRTHRPPIPLALSTDVGTLSAYQCFLRQQIECFETAPEDVSSKAQGRNSPIVVGQIGIRCVHCAKKPVSQRISGSAFYSQTLRGLYQIAQNMCKTHFLNRCVNMPESVREELDRLQQNLKRGSGGKNYWKVAAEQLGIIEDDGVLKFTPDIPNQVSAKRDSRILDVSETSSKKQKQGK